MRHASIETTLPYYVAQDAADVADELWESYKMQGNVDSTAASFRETHI